MISPESINIQSSSDIVPSTYDIRNVFLHNLQCSACEPLKSINFYKNPANIFNNLQPVNDLLNFISYHIYNYFKSALNYPIEYPHTELWFLPDKHLYGTNTECKDICKLVDTDKQTQDEDEINAYLNFYYEEKKYNHKLENTIFILRINNEEHDYNKSFIILF
jgi:hypothetical protein